MSDERLGREAAWEYELQQHWSGSKPYGVAPLRDPDWIERFNAWSWRLVRTLRRPRFSVIDSLIYLFVLSAVRLIPHADQIGAVLLAGSILVGVIGIVKALWARRRHRREFERIRQAIEGQ